MLALVVYMKYTPPLRSQTTLSGVEAISVSVLIQMRESVASGLCRATKQRRFAPCEYAPAT
jgi:hypothetical protein